LQKHTIGHMTTPSALTPASGSIVQVGPLLPDLAATLRDEFGAASLPDDRESAAFAAASGAARIAVTSGRTGLDADLIDRLPGLRAIINFGVGYDTTDVDAASRRGIVVSHTPDVLTDCVADTALALLLDVFRGFSAADRFVRAGNWETGAFPLTRRFSGARIGILGLGRIGRAIAARAEAFGTEILYSGRRPVDGVPYRYVESAVELARESDALVIAVAGGAGTTGLVDAAVIDALGPAGFLVNISRGSVVDEAALVAALEAGGLGGAGLDVFVDEPHVPAALLERDDVVLLPHVGSGTVDTRADMAALVLDNLRAFLSHGSLVTPVPETAALAR
jgi:hydroxypyruvate reductase